MSGWGSGGIHGDLVSYEKDSIVITSHEIDHIFRGKCFTVETIFNISSGDTEYDIVFDTTSCSNRIVALPTIWSTTVGDVTINLGSCASYAAGTAIIPTNRNGNIVNPADVIFKYDVTPASYVAGSTNILVGTKSTNQSSGGSTLIGTLPIILATGIIYQFRVSNNAGEDIKLYLNTSWYEID